MLLNSATIPLGPTNNKRQKFYMNLWSSILFLAGAKEHSAVT